MIVKRPIEHVKETRSLKIFNTAVPDEWICRRIEQDYAIDLEVEVVTKGEVSGKSLFVQLKSSDCLSIKPTHIDYQFETDKLSYYLQKDIPVLLVLVDLNDKQCYWLFTQEYTYDELEKKSPEWKQQKTVTLRIPRSAEWSISLNEIEALAFKGPFYLMMKKIASIQPEDMIDWKKTSQPLDILRQLKSEMTEKAQEISLEMSYQYGKNGNPEKAYSELLAVYKESEAHSKNRIKAIASLLWLLTPTNTEENKRLKDLAMEGLSSAQKCKEDAYFLFFAGVIHEADFFRLTDRLGNELTLKQITAQTSNGQMELMLAVLSSKTMRSLVGIKKEVSYIMRQARQHGQYFVYAELLRRFALMQLILYQTLIFWFEAEKIKDLLSSAKTSLDLSWKIADSSNQEEVKCVLSEDLALYYYLADDVEMRNEVLTKGILLAKKINHDGFSRSIQEKLSQYEKMPRVIKGPGDLSEPTEEEFDNLSDEEIDRIQRRILNMAGVGVEGQNNYAILSRIGLRDRNPERILRHCEHLFVEITLYDAIWGMVGLQSAGQKLLFCEKKGFALGLELDEILERFKKSYCYDCTFHTAKSQDWKWTSRWQRERKLPEEMKELLIEFKKIKHQLIAYKRQNSQG